MSANDNATDTTDCTDGELGAMDTIQFNVAGTITVVGDALPVIGDGMLTIDGLTAPGAACGAAEHTLTVAITENTTAAESGLNMDGVTDVTIRGLAIQSFRENGIQVSDSNDVHIHCNYIGTDLAGTAAMGNGKNGVLLNSGSTDVTIGTDGDGTTDGTEYNVISGNGEIGILVTEGSNANIIAGNRIGVNDTGAAALANDSIGIKIQDESSSNRVGTNSDGTSDAEERNIISGNGNHGVSITDLNTNSNIVAGNYVGLGLDGITPIGNAKAGVNITAGAANNRIGGPAASDRNYISANGTTGVWVQTAYTTFIAGTRTANNLVQNNVIGEDINGLVQGNDNQGMLIDLTVNTVIDDNTIANSRLRGIYVRGAEVTITANDIVDNRLSGIEIIPIIGTDAYSAEAEAAVKDDIISSVDITGNLIENNCVAGNPCGGIFGNDDSVDPDNRDKGATLAAANTINTNNSDPDIIQYWYGTAEITDNGVLQTGTATATSNNGGAIYTWGDSVTAGPALNNAILHGPDATFSSTDTTTWEHILEFEVAEDGTGTDYSPHVVNNVLFSFDADASTHPADTGSGFAGEGIASAVNAAYSTANPAFTLTRYQVAEAAAPYVSLAATPSVNEGNPAVVTATLNVAQAVNVTVTLQFNDGTATNSDDYTPATVTIVIPAGSTTGTVAVNTGNDTTDEPDETYSVEISAVVNATDNSTTQTTTILDDDVPPPPGAAPEVTLDATQTITEGNNAIINVQLNTSSTENVTVTLSLMDNTASSGSDYTPPTNLTVVIPAGDTSASVTMATVGDTTDESDETFFVNISSVSNATNSATQQTVTIVDDDAPPPAPNPTLPTATITTTNNTVQEGETVGITVTLDTVLTELVTFTVHYDDISAAQPADYEPNLVTIGIPAGDLSASTSVMIVDDTVNESDETFQIRIDSDVEMNFVNNPTTITIIDNDEAATPPAMPTVTLSAQPMVQEGNTVAITATLSVASTEDVTVTVEYQNDTATGDDFTPTTAIIVIPAGSLSASIVVNTVDDNVEEGVEDFRVAIANVSNANDGSTPQTVMIDDPVERTSPTALDETDEPGMPALPTERDDLGTPTSLDEVDEPDAPGSGAMQPSIFVPLFSGAGSVSAANHQAVPSSLQDLQCTQRIADALSQSHVDCGSAQPVEEQ